MIKEEFMNQKANDMTVSELASAIRIKEKRAIRTNVAGLISADAKENQNKKLVKEKPLSFGEEIKLFPERFERLIKVDNWQIVTDSDSVSFYGQAEILNKIWNCDLLDNELFYVKNHKKGSNEIIRRKRKLTVI